VCLLSNHSPALNCIRSRLWTAFNQMNYFIFLHFSIIFVCVCFYIAHIDLPCCRKMRNEPWLDLAAAHTSKVCTRSQLWVFLCIIEREHETTVSRGRVRVDVSALDFPWRYFIKVLPLKEVFADSLCLCPLHRVLLFRATFHVIKGTKRVRGCVNPCTHTYTPKHTLTQGDRGHSLYNSTHLFTPTLSFYKKTWS